MQQQTPMVHHDLKLDHCSIPFSIRAHHLVLLPLQQVWRVLFSLVVTLVCLLQIIPAHAADTQYLYDANGRLVQVTAADGSSNQYIYDETGNIISITKTAPVSIWITDFSPGNNDSGNVVQIRGGGFLPTAASNVVKFNNLAATVTAATPSLLTVTLPDEVTTGKISISNSNGTATTVNDFVANKLETTGANIPVTIAPNQTNRLVFNGVAGSGMTLTIRRLGTRPVGGTVTVNVFLPDGNMFISCSTNKTQENCLLPYLPVSGIYKLTFTAGNVAASLNLGLLPDLSGTLNINGSAVGLNITTAGQAITYKFNGVAGASYMALAMNGVTFPGLTSAMVYSPTGQTVASTTINYTYGTGSQGAIALAPLSASGSYKLRILPANGVLGRVSVNLTQDVVGNLILDGTPSNVSLLASRHQGRHTFSGTMGQLVNLGVDSLQTVPVSQYLYMDILNPDGTNLYSCSFNSSFNACHPPPLVANGMHTVITHLVDGTNSAAFQLLLSSDMAMALEVGSNPINTILARVGQAATYSFNATAGQNLNVLIPNLNIPQYADFSVITPSGAQLDSFLVYSSGSSSGNVLRELPKLPATGTYKVRVVPANGNIGSFSIGLNSDVSATITPDSPAIALNLNNQKGRYTFTGVAGQRLGLGLSGFSTVPTGYNASVILLRPDNTVAENCSLYIPNGTCFFSPLFGNGTYTLVISTNAASLTGSLRLNSDQTAILQADGNAASFTFDRYGQALTWRFNGSAGQNLNLAFSGITVPGYTYFYVTKPDGNNLTSTSVYNSSGTGGASTTIALNNLPVAGSYAVRVVPAAPGSGSGKLTSDILGNLIIDASPISVALNNQKGRYSFAGVAGQKLGVGLTGLSTVPAGNSANIELLRPDGGVIGSCRLYDADNSCYFPSLPVNGNYTLVLSTNAASLSGNLQVNADQLLNLQMTATPFTVGKYGQAITYSFNASAGQYLNLAFTNITLPGYTYLNLFDPNGSSIYSDNVYHSASSAGDRIILHLGNILLSGTYTLRMTPGGPGSGTTALIYDIQDSISMDASPKAITLSNQQGRYSFQAVVGQKIGVALTGLQTTPADKYVNITLLRPDNSAQSCNVLDANNSCIFTPITSSGSHTIILRSDAAGLSGNLQLNTDQSANLQIGANATAFTASRIGQGISFGFNASVGQNLNLIMSNITIPGNTNIFLYTPNGYLLSSSSVFYSSGAGKNITIALNDISEGGTYTLRLLPDSGIGSGGGTIRLLPDVTGIVSIDGSPQAVSLSNQKGRYTFTTTAAGQRLGIGFSGVSTSPNYAVTLTILAPNGGTVQTCSGLTGVNMGCTIMPLTIIGNYTVVVSSNADIITGNLQISNDLVTNLVPGTPATLTVTKVGQAGSFVFSGTAGQSPSFAISGHTFPGYTYFRVFKSDGTELASTYIYGSGSPQTGTLTVNNLPANDTYRIRVYPNNGANGSTTLTMR